MWSRIDWYIRTKVLVVKVKCFLVTSHGGTGVGSRGIAVFFLKLSARWWCFSASRPGRTLPPGKTWYPLYSRLGGPQGRSWVWGEEEEVSCCHAGLRYEHSCSALLPRPFRVRRFRRSGLPSKLRHILKDYDVYFHLSRCLYWLFCLLVNIRPSNMLLDRK